MDQKEDSKNNKNYVVIISGATATGKSDMALMVARDLDGEIINADIGSWYTPLTIGTAKPDWRSETITHHLFDIIDSPQHYTIVQFRAKVQDLICQIWARGKVPVIVGGSAFYIKALFYKQQELPDTSEFVHQLEMRSDNSLVLWQELQDIDPIRAAAIHPHDRYRIIRALAIWKSTNKKPTMFEQIFDPIAPFFFIVCKRDRQELYHRIDERVLIMLRQGWMKEVQSLVGTEWESFLQKKKLIGYDDLLEFLQRKKNCKNLAEEKQLMNECIAIIQKKTRHYGKRQIIFLNKLETEICKDLESKLYIGAVDEINLTLCDVGLYIKGLSNRIFKMLD